MVLERNWLMENDQQILHLTLKLSRDKKIRHQTFELVRHCTLELFLYQTLHSIRLLVQGLLVIFAKLGVQLSTRLPTCRVRYLYLNPSFVSSSSHCLQPSGLIVEEAPSYQ